MEKFTNLFSMEANGQDIASSPQYNGKIMLSSVIILFAACAMVVIFHMYSKWCTAARPARQLQQSTRRRYTTTTEDAALAWKGLDLAVVNALPAFSYESKTRESPLECAVCLSEFEDGENGRLLPECKHSFHVDCIDMWFGSHSDCPLCRARVKVAVVGADPVQLAEDPNEVIISIIFPEDTDQGSCSGSGPEVPQPSQMSSGSDGNLGSDIESGQMPTTGSVKVFKRLFSI